MFLSLLGISIATTYLVLLSLWYVIVIVAGIMIFEKAGIAGWKSIIPVYNVYLYAKLAFGNGWIGLLSFIPWINGVYYIIFNYKLAQAYGKGIGFTLGLLFLNPIFILLLAFDNRNVYVGPLSYYGPNNY